MNVADTTRTPTRETAAQPSRLKRLRDRAMARGDATGGVPGARALAMRRAWHEHPGCTWAQHRAYTLRCLAEDAPLSITDDELLVGEHLFSRETEALDFGNWGEAAERQLEGLELPDERKDEIRRFMQCYAQRKSAPYSLVGEESAEFRRIADKGILWSGGWSENHSVRDFGKVVRLGWGGLRNEVQGHLDALSPDDPEHVSKRAFYLAELAVCEAGLALGRRYAECARQQTLLDIADLCERASESGAATFREATQMLWFAHLLTCAEDNINANSLGRMDQYLWPYYEADIAAGRLTREEAAEWMMELGCKLYQQYDVQQICLGGQTSEGEDACNELTHVILEATERLDFIRCLSVRLHKGSPEALLERCARMVAKGGGIPFFFSDEEIIPALTARGIPVEDARDYAPIGCVEITIPGKTSPHAVSGRVNLAKCLELALFDGWDPVSKQQLGPQTGKFEDFASFDDLLAAYKTQVEYFSRWMAHGCNAGELRQRERGPLPCLSLLTDNCLARGQDITAAGALYSYHSIMAFGIPNAADGLMALKKLVFQAEQTDPTDPTDRSDYAPLSRAELLDALKSNFENAEPLRQRLLNDAPKYGNDDPEVDQMAAEVTRHFIELLDTFRSPLGARYFVHLFTFRWNIDAGHQTGATPDGRKAGEPIAYSVSPQQGRDRRGLTAMMNSLAKLPHDMAAGSSSAIIEVDPSVVSGDEGASTMTQLIRSGIANGIGQMQFNVTDAETLRAAQADPDRYAHLQVRVAGFSFEFVKLDEAMQEHIIARTKHAD